jgi:predicted DNA-binding transcriptional regulator YafY
MNRIDRLVAILIHLQSKRLVTAQEIADRFEMSLRTVYRDVKALEEAGVPICSEAGRGYSIMQGYHLPPVMFTRFEASALFTAYKMAEKLTDQSLQTHFQSAMFKIKSVLRGSELDYIEKLDSHIIVIQPQGAFKPDFPNNFHTIIQQALIQKQVLKIEYYSAFSKEYTTRKVEPLGLCFYSGKWHLIAYCLLRNEYRDFRLDRLKDVLHTFETFATQHPPFDSNLPSNLGMENAQKVIIQFDKDLAKEIIEQKYYYGYISEKELDNSIEMTFLSNSHDWFSYWIMSLGNKVRIIAPESLSNFVLNKVKDLVQHYSLEK